MKFYDAITETSINTILAKITKEEVKEIFIAANCQPKNSALEPDDSYISGELQYNFDKETGSLIEILVFPIYSIGESIENGDFINAPESYWKKEEEARALLRKDVPEQL